MGQVRVRQIKGVARPLPAASTNDPFGYFLFSLLFTENWISMKIPVGHVPNSRKQNVTVLNFNQSSTDQDLITFILSLFRGENRQWLQLLMLCGQFCLIELCDNFQGLSRRYFTNKQEKICHEAFSFFDSNHDGQVKIWITWELW